MREVQDRLDELAAQAVFVRPARRTRTARRRCPFKAAPPVPSCTQRMDLATLCDNPIFCFAPITIHIIL
jgi:hypothetical protein